MISIKTLQKSFDGRTILGGISLSFEKGKVTTMVGPSGGGKSTLLRCVNGLETFDAGAIDVGGLTLTPGATDRALLRAVRLKAGMVFQHYGLFSHMTALRNVMEAPTHVKKVPVEEAREQALALLERVGLSHRKDAFPRELSGGEQQRVAIARALAMEPEALLLDEPTSALDPERKIEVVTVLRDLAKAGATMVIVTHELAVVRDFADRVVTLRNGAIVDDIHPQK
ncbi:MAG: amino acid ABC transporter ATP-binding protein [Labilithrix sp.]|nr:amino acid ABC transporter ATP-binding protein [Labilithrix sp.]MCW5816221.1 amino acid ABC transporter ATP-binding protein [Labilithrix sp.]